MCRYPIYETKRIRRRTRTTTATGRRVNRQRNFANDYRQSHGCLQQLYFALEENGPVGPACGQASSRSSAPDEFRAGAATDAPAAIEAIPIHSAFLALRPSRLRNCLASFDTRRFIRQKDLRVWKLRFRRNWKLLRFRRGLEQFELA